MLSYVPFIFGGEKKAVLIDTGLELHGFRRQDMKVIILGHSPGIIGYMIFECKLAGRSICGAATPLQFLDAGIFTDTKMHSSSIFPDSRCARNCQHCAEFPSFIPSTRRHSPNTLQQAVHQLWFQVINYNMQPQPFHELSIKILMGLEIGLAELV